MIKVIKQPHDSYNSAAAHHYTPVTEICSQQIFANDLIILQRADWWSMHQLAYFVREFANRKLTGELDAVILWLCGGHYLDLCWFCKYVQSPFTISKALYQPLVLSGVAAPAAIFLISFIMGLIFLDDNSFHLQNPNWKDWPTDNLKYSSIIISEYTVEKHFFYFTLPAKLCFSLPSFLSHFSIQLYLVQLQNPN